MYFKILWTTLCIFSLSKSTKAWSVIACTIHSDQRDSTFVRTCLTLLGSFSIPNHLIRNLLYCQNNYLFIFGPPGYEYTSDEQKDAYVFKLTTVLDFY